MRYRAGDTLHRVRPGRLSRSPRAGGLADRRRDRLPGGLWLDRRGADPRRLGTRAGRGGGGGSRLGSSAGHGGSHEQRYLACGAGDGAHVPARCRLYPERHALLQQADAGGPLSPFHGGRRCSHQAGLPVQRARPDRRQPPTGSRAQAGAASERHGHQGGERRPEAGDGHTARAAQTILPCCPATTGSLSHFSPPEAMGSSRWHRTRSRPP